MSSVELPTVEGFHNVPNPKAGHSAQSPPHGPYRDTPGYLVVRHNGTMMGWFETRHDAIGEATKRLVGLYDETTPLADSYKIVYTQRGAVPFEDLRWGGPDE